MRKLAAIRGLVTNGLRSRAWPLLLGVHDQPNDEDQYAERAETPHQDSHVVECDIQRSLWTWTEGWTDEARDEKRTALKRIVNASVGGNKEGVHYYQGFHDVAAVFLFVCGEALAYRMLSRLAKSHLRDCTRPTLEPGVEVLGFLYPILRSADPELHSFLLSLREPALETPYFALSWHMTWFAHDVPSLEQCARLFDLFISSHPMMPLYVAAVAMRSQREGIMACGADGGDLVYAKLKGLRILGPGTPGADELARQAAALYHSAPPATLARRWRRVLKQSTTLDAYIENGRWIVPETSRRRNQSSNRRNGPPPKLKSLAAATAVVFTGLASVALIGTTLLVAQFRVLQLGGGTV